MNKHTEDIFDKTSWLMDRAFRIPGTRMTVGLDAIIELVPGLGDVLTTAVQGSLVLLMAVRYPGLPKPLLARMVVNIIIDCLMGTIPIGGDLFDAYFKANTRNVKLLRLARERQLRGERVSALSHIAWLAALAVTLVAVMALVLGGTFWVLRELTAYRQ